MFDCRVCFVWWVLVFHCLSLLLFFFFLKKKKKKQFLVVFLVFERWALVLLQNSAWLLRLFRLMGFGIFVMWVRLLRECWISEFVLKSGVWNWVQANVWKDEVAAWPVANPVVTCASVSDAGYPSNFVADPFLYEQVQFLPVLWFWNFILFFPFWISMLLVFFSLWWYCSFPVFFCKWIGCCII